MNGKSATKRPSVIARGPVSSLGPSGTPDIELPFGPPADALVERQQRKPVSMDVRRRIRALTNNANRARSRSPLTAAHCWQEAGRLLERHAERYAEAWVCYSRALAVYPDLSSAISALTRLARFAGADDTRYNLLSAALERAEDPMARSALLTESAAIDIRGGALKTAYEKLQEALTHHADATVPRVLLTLISASMDDAAAGTTPLQELAEQLCDTPLGPGFRLAAAQQDERSGRDSEPPMDPRVVGAVNVPVAWVHLRYCFKKGLYKEASRTLGRIIAAVDDPFLRSALARVRVTLRMVGGLEHSPCTADAQEDPLHRWMMALSADPAPYSKSAAVALDDAADAAHNPLLASALATLAALHRVHPGRINCPPSSSPHLPGWVTAGVRWFCKMASGEETRDPDALADALADAIRRGAWSEVLTLIVKLEKESTDSTVKWPLHMLGAALRITHLNAPKELLIAIADQEGNAYRQPLPAMMRWMTNRRRGLADIAATQANAEEETDRRAVLTAWAAHHMEASDPFEAARLYTEALNERPDLLFAISGLKRTGTVGRELAALYLHAAKQSTDDVVRARALISAAISLYQIDEHRRAGELMCEAALLRPKEDALSFTGLTLALFNADKPPAPPVAKLLTSDQVNRLDPTHVAPLALFAAPNAAMALYRAAQRTAPEDDIVALGFEEAHFQAHNPSPVSERLLAEMKAATSPDGIATVYQHLAHIDRFVRKDDTSAMLSVLSFAETLPGHRSTLVQLLVHHLKTGRDDEIRRAFTLLSMTVADDEDEEALARLATLRNRANADLIRHLVLKKRATLLELVNLEGRSTDPEERLALLAEMTERQPRLEVWRSRYADALARYERREEAIALYKQSMENKICVIYNLNAMIRQIQSMGDFRLLADTLVIQSDYWTQVDRKVETLLTAANIARDALKDPAKTVSLCTLALNADPTCDEAFEIAAELLTDTISDKEAHIALMETRLKGAKTPMERLVLHLKIRDLLGDFKDAASKESRDRHRNAAVAIVVNENPGFDESLPSLDQEVETEAWLEAVDHAMEHERLAHETKEDAALYAAFGDNFITFLEDEIRAEYYFKKALALDSTNETALRFMADIKLKQKRTEAAADLLEAFLTHATRPSHLPEAAMRLYTIAKEELEDDARAEKALKVANRVAPLDIAPIVALADLYDAQEDEFAATVHLDSALQRHSVEHVAHPTDRGLVENLITILKRRERPRMVAMAEDLLDIIDNGEAAESRETWTFDPYVADPSLTTVISPPEISQAVSATLHLLHDFLTGHFNLAQTFEQGEKLRRKAPLLIAVNKLAPLFGIKEVVVKQADIPTIEIFEGPLPEIVFPSRIHGTERPVHWFAAGYALGMLRSGLGITTRVPHQDVRSAVAGALLLMLDRKFTRKTDGAKAIEAYAEKIEKALDKAHLAPLLPYKTDIATALNRDNFEMLIKTGAHRMGFFAAGTVKNALIGLAAVEGYKADVLLDTPGAGLLLSFVFSRDHLLIIDKAVS